MATHPTNDLTPAPEAPTTEPLQGWIDEVTHSVISGWAWDKDRPNEPVVLQVLDNGIATIKIVANRYREHLEKNGIGDGRHSFYTWFVGGLSPLIRHVIEIRHENDGRHVPNSPFVIEAPTSFSIPLQNAVDKAIDSLTDVEDQEHALAFLARQTERLLQKRAETEAGLRTRTNYRELSRRGLQDAIPDPGLRALIIDDRMPNAERDAGSQAILSHMHALQALNYTVVFAAAHDLNPSATSVTALENEGIASCHLPYYASIEEVLQRQRGCFDLIYLHRLSNASKYLALAREYCPRARILYSIADLHHLRVARQAAIDERPELLPLSRRLRLAECTAAFLADGVLTHSSVEADWLRKSVPDAKVHVVPWAFSAQPVTTPILEREGIAFIGGYGHPPNVDAVRFLVEEIMPLVWAADASIECLLVGSDMPEVVTQLKQPRVEILGHVSDLTDIFERVRLTVAPLRYGAGVKGKVLSSLAAGVPCVMSEIAAEGIVLNPPLNELIGANAGEIAALIVRAHNDEAWSNELGAQGVKFIEDGYSEKQIAEALRTVVADIG